MLRLALLITILQACQTTASDPEYFWNLIVDGKSYPYVKSDTQLTISSYLCTMDKGIKKRRAIKKMYSRWLHCAKDRDFFRLMTECKTVTSNSNYIIIGKESTNQRTLIELSCVEVKTLK